MTEVRLQIAIVYLSLSRSLSRAVYSDTKKKDVMSRRWWSLKFITTYKHQTLQSHWGKNRKCKRIHVHKTDFHDFYT